jgi:hypothetical protein
VTGEDDDLLRAPDPRMIPRWPDLDPRPDPLLGLHPSPAEGRDPVAPADDIVIRPFLLTGGRTRPKESGLRVETLVQAVAGIRAAGLRFEHRQIVELCANATSVAEIAASMRVPIGVARVLVSDLVADGSVTLLQREELSVQLIERIRDRVRAL